MRIMSTVPLNGDRVAGERRAASATLISLLPVLTRPSQTRLERCHRPSTISFVAEIRGTWTHLPRPKGYHFEVPGLDLNTIITSPRRVQRSVVRTTSKECRVLSRFQGWSSSSNCLLKSVALGPPKFVSLSCLGAFYFDR